MTRKISVALGDGIGPEITNAVLKILDAAQLDLEYDFIDIGEQLYLQGYSSGIGDKAWQSIKSNKILLKGPITTPLGKGYKSLNVTFRKSLGLFANIRPIRSYEPYITGHFSGIDMVIVRENEEDLYAGIEYQITPNSHLSLKLLTEDGSRRIIEYAFAYARENSRKKVTCITKNNIMKITDGMFARIFEEVAKNHPEIENEHMIVDIGSARIASRPQQFDVVVTSNLYGDIISDIAAEVAGTVGLAGSANIGLEYAMFEAVHGSAPDIAGQGKANPSGLLNAALMMLRHLGMQDKAALIGEAWSRTVAAGIHTADIYKAGTSRQLASTSEFGLAVAEEIRQALHKSPGGAKGQVLNGAALSKAKEAEFAQLKSHISPISIIHKTAQRVVGYDLFLLNSKGLNAEELALKVQGYLAQIMQKTSLVQSHPLQLQSIAQKGLIIWPKSENTGYADDFLQLRFLAARPHVGAGAGVSNDGHADHNEGLVAVSLALQDALAEAGFTVVMTMALSHYDDKEGFSKAQGE